MIRGCQSSSFARCHVLVLLPGVLMVLLTADFLLEKAWRSLLVLDGSQVRAMVVAVNPDW